MCAINCTLSCMYLCMCIQSHMSQGTVCITLKYIHQCCVKCMSARCGHEGRTWLRNSSSVIFRNHKQKFWHCFSNLFVNCIVLGYSSLNISSTITDLKLKGMPNYKQVCVNLAHRYFCLMFSACSELCKDLF